MPDTGTQLSPTAVLAVYLMITQLRNVQNTRGQRGNEVLERTEETPRSGKKGKEVSRHQSRGGPVEAGWYNRNCIWWRAHSRATLFWRTWKGLTLQQEKVWRRRSSIEEQFWTNGIPILPVLLELQERQMSCEWKSDVKTNKKVEARIRCSFNLSLFFPISILIDN